MIQFRQFMGGNATIIQLNGLPVGKRFKFANFDRTFKSTRDFEAFIVEHLRNNYATTILDLSERGEFSTKGGDFEGYLRTRRMSELYPEAQFISFGPIALRIEFQERRIVRGKRRGDRTKYQISTNHRDVVAWHHHIHNPVEFSYTYNPVGNVLQEQESDLVNVVPIWLGPATVQEFDSLFIARRTRNGIESPVALDRAIEMLWGGQFRRHGPIPSFEPGNGAVSEKGVISGIDTIHYSFVLPGRRIP